MTDLILTQDTQSLINSWIELELQGEPFPVPFDSAWPIAGYSRKDSAKRALKNYFSEDEEFSTERGKACTEGRPADLIYLSCDGFKELCMISRSQTGRLTRKYFIETEKKWKLVQHHHPEVAEDVEERRIKQLIQLEELRHKNNRLMCDMATMHGKDFALVASGKGDHLVEVEKPILEVIDKRCNDRRRGMTDTQLNAYLKQKTGSNFRSGKDLIIFLEKHAPELVDLVQRPVNQGFIHEVNIRKAINILSGRHKQLLIGE